MLISDDKIDKMSKEPIKKHSEYQMLNRVTTTKAIEFKVVKVFSHKDLLEIY